MAEDFADGKFGLSAKLSHPFPEIGKQAVQVAARINGTMTQCGRRVKFSAELKQGRASVSPGECQSSLLTLPSSPVRAWWCQGNYALNIQELFTM